MADEIRVNLADAQSALRRMEDVLAGWRQNGAAAMEAIYGIMDSQQADATPWLGYVLDDLASSRASEVTQQAGQFAEDVRSYIESFGEADGTLADTIRGGVSDGDAV